MPELSFQALDVIAISKIILFFTFVVFLLAIRYKNKTWLLSLLASISLTVFYIVFSWSFKKMWWGNNGDEIFIISFLSQVLHDNPLKDFYYHGLPAFYPPLYFWITGLFSRLFTANAITAAKIGVSLTIFFWFFGTFIWQKIYYVFINKGNKNSLIKGKSILLFLFPLIYFFLIDFNDLILKPYETLPAMLLAILLGFIAESFSSDKWKLKEYLFFGISGALLFLSYYFWWFMAIPTLLMLVIFSKNKFKNLLRTTIIGGIILLLSLVYIGPLFLSYLGGIENWQALYFVPKDFSTFVSFSLFSWRGLLLLIGLIGLIVYRKQQFFKANLILVISCYLYQFISIILYVFGANALQAAKPFLFLTTASLALGAAKLFFELWQRYVKPLSNSYKFNISLIILIFSVYFWPMTSFVDDPVVRRQIDINQSFPSAFYLSESIKENVDNYSKKTWLSSGVPEINAYLNLHYFIAHNPHFSHPASLYSERMSFIKELSKAREEDFKNLLNNSPIDALLLYKQSDSQNYSLFFWADNYPNGGKELVIKIPKSQISLLQWEKAYEDKEWLILLKR
jgi:hypothetical protein